MIVLFAYILNCSPSRADINRQCATFISVHYYPIGNYLSSIMNSINKHKSFMSSLHHESILEDCMEQAITEFCEANKLTEQMFALIEDHLGVQLALDKKANAIFEARCV